MKLPTAVVKALRYLPGGLEGILLLLLLWQLAGLIWWPVLPRAQPGNLTLPAAAPTAQGTSIDALQGWFAAPEAVTETVTDLKLLAVVSGARGVALLNLGPASTVAVRVGEEVRPGNRVVSITASAVEIERNGQRQRVLLEGQNASSTASVVVTPAAKPSIAPSKSTPVARLTRGQLSGLMQGGNLADWGRGLASYREGGILIEDLGQQPLMRALKLRRGDVIRAANGKAIQQLSDISLLYHLLSQQPSVELSVLRDGSLQTLPYKIQP